jgi:hypothetical protein
MNRSGILRNTYIIIGILGGISAANAQVHVDGYFRNNGTYVAPHMRSAPDGNVFNNYSTQGNTDPYTGQQGTVNPYSNPYGSSYGQRSRSRSPYSSSYGDDD